jgi:tetratricopeptide (TPR) repeat protein
MPQNRPAIPAAIERQVLIDAGHRCAVCGAELPLERAHIIPWSRSKDHAAENLICLCANCHSRADKEKWGEETLRQYKQRPWVIRARVEEVVSPKTTLSSLHQLPPPPTDFTGRESELAELRAAVESGGVTISGVRGMGGIGKTTLALKLADELTPKYPDAQIYLDLQGVSANPVSSIQVMAHVIRSFYPDIRLPQNEAETAALYRTTLHGRCALLLMDNAADRAQVEPLLPPKDNLLLITSRSRFHLPGLWVKDLDEMPLAEARDLLLRITPRIGDQADRIAEICTGVPFALRQAAGTLSERFDLSPTFYAARLEGKRAQLNLIEASLSLSYDLLSNESATRWRILSVFPTDFDALGAAAVWDLEQEPAEAALGDLVRRSLLEGKDGRYRLHDLARVFAASRCSPDEMNQAQLQHAKHYLSVLAQADDLYLEGGPALLSGLRLFDLEWTNISAGQAGAADLATRDPQEAELAWEYPHAGAYCLHLRLRPSEWIDWLEVALTAARQLGDHEREELSLGNLGLAYAALGEPRRAIEFYEQQLAIAREIGDRRGEGNATGKLGIAYAALGEPRRAIEFYEQQLSITREIGDRRGEGNATGNLGIAYAALGEPRRAIEFYEQQLSITREIGDRRGEGNALGNLGLAYADLGETHRAIEFHEQSLTIAREIGDRHGEANTCWNLGSALETLGEISQAAEVMQVCVDYEREIGHPDAEKDAVYVEKLRARTQKPASQKPKPSRKK